MCCDWITVAASQLWTGHGSPELSSSKRSHLLWLTVLQLQDLLARLPAHQHACSNLCFLCVGKRYFWEDVPEHSARNCTALPPHGSHRPLVAACVSWVLSWYVLWNYSLTFTMAVFIDQRSGISYTVLLGIAQSQEEFLAPYRYRVNNQWLDLCFTWFSCQIQIMNAIYFFI